MDFGKSTGTTKRKRRTVLATAKVAKGRGGSVQVRFSAEEAMKLSLVPGQTLVFNHKRRFRATS